MNVLFFFFSYRIKEQKYLLESIQRVQAELRLEKYCVDWILDLMSRISALMIESSDERIVAFYCDVLFISVIYLSGMDCLLPRKELLIESRDVRIRLFPQAVSMLADRQIWKSITRQVLVIILLPSRFRVSIQDMCV